MCELFPQWNFTCITTTATWSSQISHPRRLTPSHLHPYFKRLHHRSVYGLGNTAWDIKPDIRWKRNLVACGRGARDKQFSPSPTSTHTIALCNPQFCRGWLLDRPHRISHATLRKSDHRNPVAMCSTTPLSLRAAISSSDSITRSSIIILKLLRWVFQFMCEFSSRNVEIEIQYLVMYCFSHFCLHILPSVCWKAEWN